METLQYSFQEPIPREKIEKFTQILTKNLRNLTDSSFRLINNASGEPLAVVIPYDGSHLKAMFIERKLSDALNELYGGLGGESIMGGLGLFMVNYRRYWVPILVCMIFAGLLAYLQVIAAGIDIEGGLFDEEEGGVGAAVLNGLVPVLLSAAFMTVMYLLIRRFGMKVIKIFFGVFILFYIWWGTLWYFSIFLFVIQSYQIILDIYFYGSIVGIVILFVQYLRNKLPEKVTNALVLLFSALFGALLGSILPTLSFLFFVGFFAVWDIIAVFKGPLGKIIEFARSESEKQEQAAAVEQKQMIQKTSSGIIQTESVHGQADSVHSQANSVQGQTESVHGQENSDHGQADSVHGQTESVQAGYVNQNPSANEPIIQERIANQGSIQNINSNQGLIDHRSEFSNESNENTEDDEEAIRIKRTEEIKQNRENAKMMFRDQISIGIGNGDLLFYSAFVVHTVVISQSLITSLLVFAAIFLGAKITFDRLLDILIKHELGEEHPGRQLPGLPLSMGFGILAFFLGQGIESLLLLIA